MIEPHLHHTLRNKEKSLLIGLERDGVTKWDLIESLQELGELASAAGVEVAGTVTQRLEQPTAPFYIGRGKAEHIAEQCRKDAITSVIFDDELSPAQGRNLESLTASRVIDRTQLILDIFARRASSREGRLQIELAQLRYLLPRLTRMWNHLSRQSGGIGNRGPGEMQLEVDRRRIQERIGKLEREILFVRKNRKTQRLSRKRHHWPVAALVGYTNVGKSTLLNQLTGADIPAENKLFATLDLTTRQCQLANHQKLLITDTVGFIRKLPHTLVSAFRSTLEEISEADLLIHVIDVSHPKFREQMQTVEKTLRELEAAGKQTLLVFNKIDTIANREILTHLMNQFSNSVAMSARTGEGIEELRDALQSLLGAWRLRTNYTLPVSESALIAEIHRVGHVIQIRYEADRVTLCANIPPALQHKIAAYQMTDEDGG